MSKSERLAALAWECNVNDLIQSIAEWDDRASPDDYPDHLLITPAELKEFARDVAALPPPTGAEGNSYTPKDTRCDYCKDNGFQAPNLCEDCRAAPLQVEPADDVATAWLVKPQPDFRWHFCLKKEEAEHVANNMRTYAKGCTGATIEPLYAAPLRAAEDVATDATQREREAFDRGLPKAIDRLAKMGGLVKQDADRPENITDNPKSWIAWKREAERLAALNEEMWVQFDRLRDATNRPKCGQPFMVGGRNVAPWGIVNHAIAALDLSMMRHDTIEDLRKRSKTNE